MLMIAVTTMMMMKTTTRSRLVHLARGAAFVENALLLYRLLWGFLCGCVWETLATFVGS
jgi:hypothetical protein